MRPACKVLRAGYVKRRLSLLIVTIVLLFAVFADIHAVLEALNVPPSSPKAPPASVMIVTVEAPAAAKPKAAVPEPKPTVSQSGRNNIAQPGDNNQAVINPESLEKTWVITDDICRKLLGGTRSVGSIQVIVGAFMSDPDGANVVGQLSRCLPLVRGWTVQQSALPRIPDGVTVMASPATESTATSVRDALRSIGFDANLQILPTSTEIDITIGKKAFKRP